MRVTRSLKFKKQGNFYVLQDNIKLSKKRYLLILTSKTKRI